MADSDDKPRRKPEDASGADEPGAAEPDAPRLTPEEVMATLALPEAAARMRAAILAVLRKKRTAVEADDVFQAARMKAMTAGRGPRVGGNTLGWLGVVAANEAHDALRVEAAREEVLGRKRDVAEEEHAPLEAPRPQSEIEADLDWLLDPWLDGVVHDPRDRQTLALIRRKAREDKTSDQIGAEELMTANAFDKRVAAFIRKYGPMRDRARRRRFPRMMMLLRLFAGVAVVVGGAALLWWLLHREPAPRILRDPEEFQPPRPKATATQEPFNQALPTPPSAEPAPVPPQDQKPIPPGQDKPPVR